MSEWIAISPSMHKNKHYLPRSSYAFASDKQTVPILVSELSNILPQYVIGFIKEQSTYLPVVLTSLGGGNLYLNADGKWLGSYVPAALRGYPFASHQTQDKHVLCIHANHLSDDQGSPIFDSEGKLTSFVQDTLNFLQDCDKSREITLASCQSLQKAGVIEKWDLQVKQSEKDDPIKIDGLYRINEKALIELDAETFAGLRKNGALALAYAQLFSMKQIDQLVDRAKYLAQQKQEMQPKQEGGDVDKLFGAEDDIISFDNI